MLRIPIAQTDKVRAVDDASSSGSLANLATAITERLQHTTTNSNVAVARLLHDHSAGAPLAAWVLDESKAYRQIAAHPDH